VFDYIPSPSFTHTTGMTHFLDLQQHALMTKRLSVQCEAHSCVVLVIDCYKTTPSQYHPPCSLPAKTLCLCASMPVLLTKSWLCRLWLVYCYSNTHFIPWKRLTATTEALKEITVKGLQKCLQQWYKWGLRFSQSW